MSYYVLLGKNEMYGDLAVGESLGYVYKGFRFRDPICKDTGRTKEKSIVPLFDENITALPTTKVEETSKDIDGFIWRIHEGQRPDDHFFDRNVLGKIMDNRPDNWQWGTRTNPKQNPQVSTNEGFIQSSTIAVMKQRGILK